MAKQPVGKQEVEDMQVSVEAGETTEKQTWGTVNVSNAAGKARSHIELTAKWNVPPQVLFSIFTYPDNTKLFRDIQAVGQRRVVSTTPGLKIIEVEQLQELKVLWIRKTFSTWLHVEEDGRNPDHMVVTFDLLKSDVLARFHGRWDIKSVRDASGAVVACEATLNQDVLPRGIPPFLKHIPVAGDLMRAVTMRAIKRVMEDVDTVIKKITAGLAKGITVQDTLRHICGVCQEAGHANGAVASFAFDASADADSDEDEQPDTDSDVTASKGSAELASVTGSHVGKEKPQQEEADQVKEVMQGIDALHVHAGVANGAFAEPTVLPAAVRVAASS